MKPTRMCSFVYLEIFTPGKHLSARWKRTREWFLSGVDPDVVDQFVLGLKGLQGSGTPFPQTGMIALLGSTNVLHGYVGHYFVHRVEDLHTRFETGQTPQPCVLVAFVRNRLFVFLSAWKTFLMLHLLKFFGSRYGG